MSTHYIYNDNPDNEQLYQGDVLERTPELISLLSQFHHHYAEKEDYQYFLVITQSCDLQRRDGKNPKSPYISIAAVRPVEDAIWREAKKYQEWWQIKTRIISDRNLQKLIMFVDSMIDNNAPNYFYLHEDLNLGISGYNCAFLALSVALKIEHYDLCLSAKKTQLKNEFQAKLGWLVGDMYSRVGTVEWQKMKGEDVSVHRKILLKKQFLNYPDKRIISSLEKLVSQKPILQYSPEEIANFISTDIPTKVSKQFSNRLMQVLENCVKESVPGREKIISQLHGEIVSDAMISSLIQRLD
jgi:hypothetical protein